MTSADELKRAEVVEVAGEAARVTFKITHLTDGAQPSGLADERFIGTLQDEFCSRLGATYLVEDVILGAGQRKMTFKVVGNDSYPRDTSLSLSTKRKSWFVEMERSIEASRRLVRLRLQDSHPGSSVEASWRVGSGVGVLRGPVDLEAPDSTLLEVLRELRRSEALLRRRGIWALCTAALLVILGSTGFLYARDKADPFAITCAYLALYGAGVAAFAASVRSDVRSKRAEIHDLTMQRELKEVLSDEEKRAYKVFQVNEAQLRRYYAQALRQGTAVFALGVACIAAGFGVIATSFTLIHRSDTGNVSDKVVIAALGGAGSVMSNFIALLFLRMYTGTTESLTIFHDRMVLTHHVHFGSVLTAKIRDDQMRDETLAAMARSLATQTPHDAELGPGEQQLPPSGEGQDGEP